MSRCVHRLDAAPDGVSIAQDRNTTQQAPEPRLRALVVLAERRMRADGILTVLLPAPPLDDERAPGKSARKRGTCKITGGRAPLNRCQSE